MNPISNLVGLKFKKLTSEQLIQVINAYFDENKYFDCLELFESFLNNELLKYRYKEEQKKDSILHWFKTSINPIQNLETFFKYWTN